MTNELKAVRARLLAENNGPMLALREQLWGAGLIDAALDVDAARLKLSAAAHDLRRCETRLAENKTPF